MHPGEDAARSHPTMPPVKPMEQPVAPDLSASAMPPVQPSAPKPTATPPTPTAMPPITGKAEMAAPDKPLATSTANIDEHPTMPPVSVGPQTQRYEDLAKQGEPKLTGWKNILDKVGQFLPFGKAIEREIGGTPQNYDAKLNQAALRAAKEQMLGKGEQEHETAAAQAQFNTPEKRRAFVKANPDLLEGADKFQINDWVATGNKFPTREPMPKTERPENLDREAYDYYVSQGMTPADARKRVLQDAQSVKPERQTHTSAFEAFAYGSPEEKKAAQDYIDLEKKSAARYRTPSEFDEKFRLFKEDPETYKAMFGDKAGMPDRATATRMLNYFDKRRREVNGDFMLDETQKQEQLRDIENLEKPFMDAVQPGKTDRAGGDRVNVIGPDGTPGTIPRKQLDKAKRKGYREAPTR